MTEVLVAIVTTVGLVMVAMLERTRQHAKAAREQVQNSHESNLRDDIDRKFEVVHERLDVMLERLDHLEPRRRRRRLTR